MKYRVKNWRQFQHYKDRNPPWIKLHFSMLSSADWVVLDDRSRVLAVACMLIASRTEGEIDGSDSGLAYLQRVAYLGKKPDLTPLINCGFLESASKVEQKIPDARPETETENLIQTEQPMSGRPDAALPAKPKPNGNGAHLAEGERVLDYLNRTTGRDFRFRSPNGKLTPNADVIVARLGEGYTGEQLCEIVLLKSAKWKGDEKMAEFLRPATLFGKQKFAQYLGELGAA